MSKNLDKMQKWHTFCLLKGIDVEENFYSILSVMELIDKLQTEIESNKMFYDAAIECRRMSIDRKQLERYKNHLEELYEKKQQQIRRENEEKNPVLVRLKQQHDFKFINDRNDSEYCTANFNITKNKENLAIHVDVKKTGNWFSDSKWMITYSWFDHGIFEDKKIIWNPRVSSLKYPEWFPQHWKTEKHISEAKMVALLVAWKIINGKARHMGGNPQLTSMSHSLRAVEDIGVLKSNSAKA